MKLDGSDHMRMTEGTAPTPEVSADASDEPLAGAGAAPEEESAEAEDDVEGHGIWGSAG